MYNKVILVGNLSRDIELRYTQGGTAIVNTAIATNRKYKKQNGEQAEEVMFIDLTFFGRTAEIANQYLHKGSKVLVEGRLVLDQWTDQSGQKRSKHTVSVEEMKMLDSRGQANGQPQQQQYQPPAAQQGQPQPTAYAPNGAPVYREPAPQQNRQRAMPEMGTPTEDIPFSSIRDR